MITNVLDYLKNFIKWIAVSFIVGLICGLLGSLFHICIDLATSFRHNFNWIIYLLPVGGIFIIFMYQLFKKQGKLDTNRIIDAVKDNQSIPFVTVPLIFVSTVITHLLGGSAGREGAALQIGGGLGYSLGRIFKLNENDKHIIVMAGMAGVFAALFGTPITAAIFSLEVIRVGKLNYSGLLPCIISAIVAFKISDWFGIEPTRFVLENAAHTSFGNLFKVLVLATMCALLCIVFCFGIRKTEKYMKKFFKNRYLRSFLGAILVLGLTLIFNSGDYNGAGTEVIQRAIMGNAKPEAFFVKLVFTAITLSAGFKGGEIVPAFFVGSTFGCVVAPLLGLDAGFAAAIGFVSLFCGVVNCPVASVVLSYEVFGGAGILLFALACAVSYAISGNYSLYKSQEIVFSKLTAQEIQK
ncbi:MAG: chloride channel protein [Clostridia bacterium]|nr:chloride channel protein [Clostridia bacterium]